MAEIMIMGELLVEVMRAKEDVQLYETGEYFRGPFPSGAPGIFASTAARLKHSTGIISGVGNDDFGKNILDRLNQVGVDIRRVIVSDAASTGVAFVTYFADGERKFLFHINNTPAVMAKAPENLEDLNDCRFFHIMGCSLMASIPFGQEILKTMHMLKGIGAKVSFDPNVRLEMLRDPKAMDIVREAYENCNIFMPGRSEIRMITGEEDLEKALQKAFSDNHNLELIVLKSGSEGSKIYTREGLAETMGIYKVTQVDPTGAGDSYDAAFICGLAEGKSLKDAARMGAAAGALNAAAFGPMEGNISRETVSRMIAEIDL
ncbi:MAG: sugar kinase [Oscillospiraceae bacterium]|nr:sugar kinase [Oscillospiraceae bacterium]